MTAERTPSSPENLLSRIISPMTPRDTLYPPSHPENWLCEVKWNGIHAIVYIEKGNDHVAVRTKPRKRGQITRNVAAHFPELDLGFRQLSKNHSLILVGEIVSGNGKTMEDVVDVARRLGSGPDHVAELVQTHPCQFVAFDILHKDNRELRQIPLDRRKKILADTIPVTLKEHGIYTNPFRRRYYDTILTGAKLGGYEGVVFKRRNSPYQPGVESGNWLKYKFRR